MRKKVLSSGIALTLAVATLAGSPIASLAAESEEKVLNINIASEPSTLDPNNGLSDQMGIIYSLVYEPLCRLDAEGNASVGMATDWTVSEDGLTYTFTIREDNAWSDGTPATAADFEYAIKRVAKQEAGSNWAQLAFDIKNVSAAFAGEVSVDEVGIHADGNQLVIELEQPEEYFTRLLAFSIYQGVNQQFVEASNGTFGTDVVIGSGPYYVESWKHDDLIVLKKNPYYWNADNIDIDTINCYVIADSNTATNMFLSNELDFIQFTGTQKSAIEAAGYEVQSYDSGRSVYLEFNVADPVLSNTKIRQALSAAVDRETLVANVIKDASTAATGLVTGSIAGTDGKSYREIAGDVLKYSYDEEQAKQLFQEGLDELGIKAEDVKLSIIAKSSFAESSTVIAALQEIYQSTFGITVEVQALDNTTYSSRSSEYDYQIRFVSWGADWNDATTFLTQFDNRDPEKTAKYTNEEFNRLFDLASTDVQADGLTRIGYLKSAEEILLDEAGCAPLYFKGQYYAISDKLSGIITQSVIPYIDFTQTTINE